MPADQTTGTNPPTGAGIAYWLSQETAGSDVTVRISDDTGEVIRDFGGPSSAGINRVLWNFQGEASTRIRLRTTPLYADWVDLGPDRVRTRNGLRLRHAPGTYTVTLEVDGQEYSQRLTVLKDPNSEGSVRDVRAQLRLLQEIRRDYEAAARAINQIEAVRRQLYDLVDILEDQDNVEDLIEGAGELDASLIEVEETLIQLRNTGTGQDGVRDPARVTGKLRHLANGVGTADFPPTDQQGEVHALLRRQLEQARADLEALVRSELADYNRRPAFFLGRCLES